jgi:pyridoxal phosphate enzyme (YggS family)
MQSGLTEVLQQIEAAARKAGRNDVPALMAVSKFQPFEKMHELYLQGQKVFGENYVQELIDKKQQFQAMKAEDADLQFIGHLQTNKVKSLLPYVTTIHSVDSLRLVEEIEKRAGALQKKIHCYFQINIDEEESKGGFREADLALLIEAISKTKWIIPAGLMCIPDPEKHVKNAFLHMKKLSESYVINLGAGLSMGMSSDYEVAIECGATVVRIGSALFGSRKNSAPK